MGSAVDASIVFVMDEKVQPGLRFRSHAAACFCPSACGSCIVDFDWDTSALSFTAPSALGVAPQGQAQGQAFKAIAAFSAVRRGTLYPALSLCALGHPVGHLGSPLPTYRLPFSPRLLLLSGARLRTQAIYSSWNCWRM